MPRSLQRVIFTCGGTAGHVNPALALDVIDGMERYLEEKNIGNISEICGII